jgi:hypothetical protein
VLAQYHQPVFARILHDDTNGEDQPLIARLCPKGPKLGPRLLAAQSSEEIVRAVREDAAGITGSLVQFSELILEILHDPKFPHTRTASQIHFLSDSLGGQGFVTPRRSREICAEERTKVRHVIVRREYYIECSCGYEGPARDGACRNCGTGELSWDLRSKESD